MANEEKDFFPLKNPREKEYYFAITEASVEKPETLERVKTYVQKTSKDLRSSFFIHPTEHEKDLVYYITFSFHFELETLILDFHLLFL